MKRLLFLFASLIIISLSSCIRQDTVTTIGDYTYKMRPDGLLQIMSYNGTDSVITIPQKTTFLLFQNYDIVFIHSLGGNKYVQKIIIPDDFNQDGVIYSRAFEGCSNLSDIEINDWSRFVISSNTFKSTKIGKALYNRDKTKLYSAIDTAEFTIPPTVRKIAEKAFSEHNQLKRINLPESIQEIGSQAFMNCENLEEITIPSSVKEIKRGTFSNNRRLKKVILSEGIRRIGYGAFQDCESLEEVDIPSTVKEIEDYAFSNNKQLKRAFLQEGIQRIGSYAFSNCENLEQIGPDVPDVEEKTDIETDDVAENTEPTFDILEETDANEEMNEENEESEDSEDIEEREDDESPWDCIFPSSLKSIGDYAFSGTGLSNIVLLNEPTLSSNSFSDCKRLESIYLTVKKIPNEAFKGCSNLRYAHFVNGLESIGHDAFRNCILEEIEIPESVTNIGEDAFPLLCHLYGNQKVISEYKQKQREKNQRESQSSANSSSNNNVYGPEWINGTWVGRFPMDILGKVSYFTVRLEINQKTGKIRSIDVDNNQIDEGTYKVENGVIRAYYPFAGGTTVLYDIDEYNHRIDYGDGHYLKKSSDTSSNQKQERTENIVFRSEQDVRNYLSRHSFKSEGGSKLRFQNNAYEMYWNGNCICTYLKITNIEADAAILLADGPYGKAAYALTLQPFGNSIVNLGDGTLYWEVR